MPDKGVGADELLERMEGYRAQDLPWREGKAYAYMYDPGAEAERVAKRAFVSYMSENALDPTAFPSLLRFETELVAMAASHLGGDELDSEVVGSFTSGGTESIMLACKSARELWRAEHPGDAGVPEIVLPSTAHAAFHKSAAYLGMETVVTDVDATSFVADVHSLRAAIGPRTALLVASAPGYAHGVIDPIDAIGRIAKEAGVRFHVDACVGGFLLPFWRELGEDVPPFDFRVQGVTSISMDFHKYGFAPKGASVVLYRDKSLREAQIYACAAWTGYTVVNPTVQSSKGGGPVAAAWAVVQHLGAEGYRELARGMHAATRELVAGLEAIEGLEVMGSPDFCLVAARGQGVSVFHVADEMKERGWYVQPQLALGPSPENIHFSIQPGNAGRVGEMLGVLAESVEAARRLPSGRLAASLKALLATLPGGALTDEMFGRLLGLAGMGGVDLPGRMAEINEVMNTLPPAMREALLVKFLNELYVLRGAEAVR